MEQKRFVALDLGAESGRAVVGHLDGDSLRLEEVHRFPNGPVRVNGRLHWDVLRLWTECKQGIRQAVQQYGSSIASIGLDTWGVDFGLLDAHDNLVGNPYHYRDSRTDGMMDEVFRRVPREEVFEHTGIQFMQLNSLYQLYSMRLANEPALDTARTFLTMPDLFNFWLTGRKACEFSNATTTQCYDPRRKTWATAMLGKLGSAVVHLSRDRAAGHSTWADASGCCLRVGHRPHTGDRPGMPRHRVGSSGGAGRGTRLCLHQLRHVVVDGGRGGRSGDHLAEPALQFHQ